MDITKIGKADVQRQECLEAIRKMHLLRADIGPVTIDYSEKFAFIGYRLIPLWNGFLGDRSGYVHLYFMGPYQGNLNTLYLRSKSRIDETGTWLGSYREDFERIIRHTKTQSQVDYDLWNYNLENGPPFA